MVVSYFNNLGAEWRSLLAYSTLAAKTYWSPQREDNLGFHFTHIAPCPFQLEK